MTVELKQVLDRWSVNEGDLEEALKSLENPTVNTAAEAASLLTALEYLVRKIKEGRYQCGKWSSALYELAVLVQNIELDELEQTDGNYFDEVYFSVNRLADACETLLKTGLDDERGLPFACKVLAMWRHPRNVRFMAQVATDDRYNDSYLWEVAFRIYAKSTSETRLQVAEALKDPLPQAFMGVAYLDFTNRMAIAGELNDHPFNSDAGKARLRAWLTDLADNSKSYFQSATAALPWIDEPARTEFLSLAQAHPAPLVQMEVAWVKAKLGNPEGIDCLQGFASNLLYAERAQAYLQEFGVEAAVLPPEDNPDFWALSTTATWLSDPNEFGRMPDELEIYDTQVLFWPPTDDRRQVWLLKFAYNDLQRFGLAMTGSITFALRGIETAELSPVEAYGLHCAWELQHLKDPRAPQEVSANGGVSILKEYNPQL
jgi:hypothetical protein